MRESLSIKPRNANHTYSEFLKINDDVFEKQIVNCREIINYKLSFGNVRFSGASG